MPVIKVENLSKQYRLGTIGTGTLSHDLNRWWHKVRGKEDPYLKVGEANDRATKGSSDYVWALRDINFEVEPGEVLGIIGKNGAGKSTLLKILSRVTKPTTGSIKVKGRIASLLEVGTGFHPELTGRENIFLNGAILGMTKAEIRRKFDEIVDFAGVDRYIDTPVKRYSSGMYVRLAFAVAAHLEPEILIVDEVLAVGDAEFQKKALGKMQDVSKGEGRTVLFVSHNMAAVKSLCGRGIILKNGFLKYQGNAETCVEKYLIDNKQRPEKIEIIESENVNLSEVVLLNKKLEQVNTYYSGEDVNVSLLIKTNKKNIGFSIAVQIVDANEQVLVYSYDQSLYFKMEQPTQQKYLFKIPNVSLAPGTYSINVWIGSPGIETYLFPKNLVALQFLQGVNTKLTDQWRKELGLYYLQPELSISS